MQKTGDQTYLAQVIDLVRKAQESRSRTQDLANRAAFWLTVIALSVGGATLAFWLLFGKPFEFALARSVTVMVITCPHALGLAVPLVVAVSTAISAANGLLIRDRSAFERARNVQAILFVRDKTGTLTEARFGVTDVITLGPRDQKELLPPGGGAGEPVRAPDCSGHRPQCRGKRPDLRRALGVSGDPG